MAKTTKKSKKTSVIADLFSKGQYQVISQTYQTHASSTTADDLPFVIGALSFLGKTFEAQELYNSQKQNLSTLGQTSSLFFLGVGVTRKSLYKRARRIFKLNQQLYAKNEDPEIAFYSFQGIAFYLFFTGRFFRCEQFAKKSFQLAIQSGNAHFKVLAQDLLAQTLIKTGQVYEGLNLLKETHALAIVLGNKAFAEATKVSILLREAEHGHRPSEMVGDLTASLNGTEAQDSYSKSNLALELARQKTMRGQWLEAEKILNQQAPVIFASENRRQEITLNLHWSKIAFLRGQYVLAWQFLRSAQLRLHNEADKNFAVQILSMEIDILEVQKSPLAEERKAQLLALNNSFSSQVSRNILARKNWIANVPASGDAIHDVLAKISSKPATAVNTISDSGYYSWYYRTLPLQRGRNYIVLGAKKNCLAIFSYDGIELNKLTGSSLRLLEVLKNGAITKAQLVQEVWGYEYHPLRHDNLVYSAMSTLRKTLGNKHHWILTSESGYELLQDVEIVHVSAQPPQARKAPAHPLPVVSSINTDLNYRQLQALDYLQENRFLSTREYKTMFSTSEITASRDLAALNKKGHVLKIGHGRSTHYTLSQGSRT